MRDDDLLFFEPSLEEQLKQRLESVRRHVDEVPEGQFRASTDDQLLQSIEAVMRVEPVALREEGRVMHGEECRVDVSADHRYARFENEQKGVYVPGARVVVSVPFDGEPWILQFRPSTYATVFPRAVVLERKDGESGGTIALTFEQALDNNEQHEQHDQQAHFKTELDRELTLIERYLERARTQVDGYNRRLPGAISKEVKKRRQRLERLAGLSDALGIPPEPAPASRISVPLPVAALPFPQPARQLESIKENSPLEPGVTDESYERVLNVLRHALRTFETTPSTYAKLDEEELRDVLLSHLNSYFQGPVAAGEVFRRSGKTDICVQEQGRAAFVGECKVWGGYKQISGDINQLLGYLTWRDSKAALIVFNKAVAEFSSIVGTADKPGKLPEAVAEHNCFVRRLECKHAGEWRYLLRSAEDKKRSVTLHVFAINIYPGEKKGARIDIK